MLPNGCRILLFVDFVTFYQKMLQLSQIRMKKIVILLSNSSVRQKMQEEQTGYFIYEMYTYVLKCSIIGNTDRVKKKEDM